MAYCLTAPSHYLNQHWFIITKAPDSIRQCSLRGNALWFQKIHLSFIVSNYALLLDEPQSQTLIIWSYVPRLWGFFPRKSHWVNLCFFFSCIRADPMFVPSQWETVLLCNDGSDWLGASLESALCMHLAWFSYTKHCYLWWHIDGRGPVSCFCLFVFSCLPGRCQAIT